ncbi:group II intron maturase-specific domain-containing protein [Streptomyces olivaceoviridis]|uniref:group II intron maturase-specific domain-containing protein n=1 Tax=Streptomyces olivaceoviridis TaxID=1921 RepID=UPI00331A5716
MARLHVIADKPVQALKRKIKALTQRLSHLDFKIALIRINRILRGWANYFKHAVAKHTMARLHTFVWWRVIHWVMHRHRMKWKAVRRWLRTPHKPGHGRPLDSRGALLAIEQRIQGRSLLRQQASQARQPQLPSAR